MPGWDGVGFGVGCVEDGVGTATGATTICGVGVGAGIGVGSGVATTMVGTDGVGMGSC